jgi:hypothetical protein
MSLFPTAPTGNWDYSCRPIGAQLVNSLLRLACAVFAYVTAEVFIGKSSREILAAPAGVLVAAIVIRARRIGVWADAERVVVQNFWLTHEFKWADVSSVENSGFDWGPGSLPRSWWVFRMRNYGGAVISEGRPLFGAADATDDLVAVSGTAVEITDA